MSEPCVMWFKHLTGSCFGELVSTKKLLKKKGCIYVLVSIYIWKQAHIYKF